MVIVGGVWVALVLALLIFGECCPEIVVCRYELSVVVVGGVILHLPVEVVDSGTGFRLAVGRS